MKTEKIEQHTKIKFDKLKGYKLIDIYMDLVHVYSDLALSYSQEKLWATKLKCGQIWGQSSPRGRSQNMDISL